MRLFCIATLLVLSASSAFATEQDLAREFAAAHTPTDEELHLGEPWRCFWYNQDIGIPGVSLTELQVAQSLLTITKTANGLYEIRNADYLYARVPVARQESIRAVGGTWLQDESHDGLFVRARAGRLFLTETSNFPAWVEAHVARGDSMSTLAQGHIENLHQVCVLESELIALVRPPAQQ